MEDWKFWSAEWKSGIEDPPLQEPALERPFEAQVNCKPGYQKKNRRAWEGRRGLYLAKLRPDGPFARQVEWGDQAMKLMLACAAFVVMSQDFLQEPAKSGEERAAADAKATDAKAGDAAKLVNPTKATPESIALGKKAYGTDCAMCHGKTGAGDGDLAVDMKLKLKDYREPDALKAMTDGEIYWIIERGKGQMSGEEGRMKAGQIWDVVNYVRSLGKKS